MDPRGLTAAARTRRVRFRSVRRRLVLALTPVILGVLAVVAIGVGRTSRIIVQPLVEKTDTALITVLADQLRRNEATPVEILRTGLPDNPRTSLILAEGTRPAAVAGDTPDPTAAVRRSLAILGAKDHVTEVNGIGPIRLWLLNAIRVDDDRVLILERRITGFGGRFTTSVLVLTAVVGLLGVAVPVAIARGLYRPLVERLETMERALSRYGAGETGVRLGRGHRETHDEFDQVFEAFDEMAERISSLERERVERNETERALLADLAHDVNTPVTVLRGWAETLLERGDELSPLERRGAHGELLGQSLYIQAIVEDLLTLASARTAQLAVEPAAIPVDPLFDAIIDGFSPMAVQRGVAVIGDGGGLSVWADPVRLRQILTNLVRNALVHARGASVIELSAERDGRGVTVAVADDGAGVAEDAVPHLFERNHHSARTDSGGWGLGLGIVAMLTELHGGRTGYRPQDPGSRFEVWLPDRPAAAFTESEPSG